MIRNFLAKRISQKVADETRISASKQFSLCCRPRSIVGSC